MGSGSLEYPDVQRRYRPGLCEQREAREEAAIQVSVYVFRVHVDLCHQLY